MSTDGDRERAKTTETTLEILDVLFENGECRVTEIAAVLDVAKSTVHRHLATLHDHEYVVNDGGVYSLSFRFLELGERTRDSEAYRLAAQKVEELADETDERAQFIVPEHGQGVYVFRETGEHAVQTDSGIGHRIPLHATSAGKAILAHLPKRRVDEIIERHGLESYTAATITDEAALREDLREIRERGYSVNDQENLEGLRAIGVPIRYADGRVIGALSVSGPTHRFTGDYLDETVPGLLLGTANELELNIQYL